MDNFTKMCNTPEVQDLWEPKVGDAYIIGGVRPGDKHFSITTLGCCWEKCEGCSFEVNQLREDCLWLPTIEQLMGMVLSKPYLNFPGRHYLKLGKTLSTIPWAVNFNSHQELWLAFVMHENFSVKWDGEKWVKNS